MTHTGLPPRNLELEIERDEVGRDLERSDVNGSAPERKVYKLLLNSQN